MSEPDLAKQAAEESAASVPTEAPPAVGAPSSEDGGAASPRDIDKRLAPIERAGFSDAVIATLGFIAMVGLAAMAAIYTPTPVDQVALLAAPAAALDAPSLAPAITSTQVAPVPAPDGSGSGLAAGQPAAYKPVAFAWVIELGDGPYLLTSLGETGSSYSSPPRGTNGDGTASFGHAFQSYRGTSPNPAFDALLEKRFVLFNGNTQCEAVAEDVGLLAWFTDYFDVDGSKFVERLRAEDGSIPAQPELGLPAFSKDDPEPQGTFAALVEKDPTLTARITMQAAEKMEKEGSDYPLRAAVKLRIISNGEACSHVGESWVGRSAELPPILVTSPSRTTKKALGLDKARLWPSSKEIDSRCGWRGRKPLRREFDFNAQPDALTWTISDGTEYAWADYRKVWETRPVDSDSPCMSGLIIEVFWKRRSGARNWTRDLIFESPDDNYSGPDLSNPPFLIVDLQDGSARSVICEDSYHCLADSNPLPYGPPHELELNVTN